MPRTELKLQQMQNTKSKQSHSTGWNFSKNCEKAASFQQKSPNKGWGSETGDWGCSPLQKTSSYGKLGHEQWGVNWESAHGHYLLKDSLPLLGKTRTGMMGWPWWGRGRRQMINRRFQGCRELKDIPESWKLPATTFHEGDSLQLWEVKGMSCFRFLLFQFGGFFLDFPCWVL